MTGAGVVTLRTGDTFEGYFETEGDWLRFTGRLVTQTLTGTLYRAEVVRIWPRERIERISEGGAS